MMSMSSIILETFKTVSIVTVNTIQKSDQTE